MVGLEKLNCSSGKIHDFHSVVVVQPSRKTQRIANHHGIVSLRDRSRPHTRPGFVVLRLPPSGHRWDVVAQSQTLPGPNPRKVVRIERVPFIVLYGGSALFIRLATRAWFPSGFLSQR